MPSGKPYRRDGLIAVAEVQGQLAAQVLKSKLEAVGIPVMLQYESYGVVLGVTVDGLGRVRVMVPEDLYDQACEVLAVGPDDEDSDPFCDETE